MPPSLEHIGLYGWNEKKEKSHFIVGVTQCAESTTTISSPSKSQPSIVLTPPYKIGITTG